MKFIADLHIHSKYARAVSPRMILPELDKMAQIKGIQVMGTGDFTHPAWYEHLVKNLEPDFAEASPGKPAGFNGLYKLANGKTRFLLTTEIACIYTRGGRGRRIHVLLFAPSLKVVKKINDELTARGKNLRSDGRPIIGLDVVEVLKIALDASPECVMVPAHVWTPWFGILGSKSGFNSFEECFGDYTKHIFALETGLSSDPVMNWRLSALDNIAIMSNSDSHSPERIGREANIFDTELSYAGIMGALKKNDPKSFLATIEYFPEEGMYHYDGHRKCGVSYDPEETLKKRGICSVCKKPVTVGVLNRLEKLADRTEAELKVKDVKIGEVIGKGSDGRVPFINLVTLDTIIAEALGVGDASKKVKAQYDEMIKTIGTELDILMNIPLASLQAKSYQLPAGIPEGIRRMRARELLITPGYDGEYGVVKLF